MRDDGKERDVSYEELFNDCTFLTPLTPVYERTRIVDDDNIEASVQEATENSGVTDDFQSRLENVSNAAQKLYQSLRLRKEAMGKFPEMAHALIQKIVSVLPVRARARSYRSHRKTATASSSSGDDDGGDSDSSDPPARRYHHHHHVIPLIIQTNSFSLAVVFPRHMPRGLEEAVAA